jgi:2,3-dihydroxybiphenyl 1,2-dioxygenase
MTSSYSLGYLAFAARHPDRWSRFLGSTLGLPTAADTGGAPAWRLDEAAQRLIVAEGPADDLQAIGLDAQDEAGLARAADRLTRHGFPVHEADAALRRERRVRQLLVTTDPQGTSVELFVGLAPADAPFASPRFGGGFRTGELGFGHAALIAHDMAAMERFYVDALGFAVTERLRTRAGPLEIEGAFLHCNRRHHSLALFDMPLRKRLHHFMLQTNRLADVGAAFEQVRRDRVPVSLGLGQHPDPDGTFSFYAETPSGFDFEIGWGGAEIEPQAWRAQQTTTASAWGHRPTPRLQLKVARALLGRWLSMPRAARVPAPSARMSVSD